MLKSFDANNTNNRENSICINFLYNNFVSSFFFIFNFYNFLTDEFI